MHECTCDVRARSYMWYDTPLCTHTWLISVLRLLKKNLYFCHFQIRPSCPVLAMWHIFPSCTVYYPCDTYTLPILSQLYDDCIISSNWFSYLCAHSFLLVTHSIALDMNSSIDTDLELANTSGSRNIFFKSGVTAASWYQSETFAERLIQDKLFLLWLVMIYVCTFTQWKLV